MVGDYVKKVFSWIFFILANTIFVYDMYFGIAGAIEVNHQFAELTARGASGHEFFGVGLDFLVIGVIFISIVGGIISLISWKIAQYKFIRITSVVMYLLFLLPCIIVAVILML